MVSSLLRPLFQRTARGFNTPQGRMFALGTTPLMIDSLTDTGNLTPADFQDDVTTDIDTNINVTTKDPEPQGPVDTCLLYTSPSPRDGLLSRMPSSA